MTNVYVCDSCGREIADEEGDLYHGGPCPSDDCPSNEPGMYALCMHEIYHAEQQWRRFDKYAAIAGYAQRLGVEVFNFAPAQCRPEDVRGYLIPKWWTIERKTPSLVPAFDRNKWNEAADAEINIFLDEYPRLWRQARDELVGTAIGSDTPRLIVTDGMHFRFVSGERK